VILRLEHIDAISRRKNRDVIYIDFISPAPLDGESRETRGPIFASNWEANLDRIEVIAWLASEGIAWQPCAPFANPNVLQQKYNGQIYVDIPVDAAIDQFIKLERFLENPDGTPRLRGVRFQYCSFEDALQNSKHDEPGFWENWADSF
jgi:hypothetical protein